MKIAKIFEIKSKIRKEEHKQSIDILEIVERIEKIDFSEKIDFLEDPSNVLISLNFSLEKVLESKLIKSNAYPGFLENLEKFEKEERTKLAKRIKEIILRKILKESLFVPVVSTPEEYSICSSTYYGNEKTGENNNEIRKKLLELFYSSKEKGNSFVNMFIDRKEENPIVVKETEILPSSFFFDYDKKKYLEYIYDFLMDQIERELKVLETEIKEKGYIFTEKLRTKVIRLAE